LLASFFMPWCVGKFSLEFNKIGHSQLNCNKHKRFYRLT
jgi:hypothetical protein